jgi:hypothetical protein
MKEGAQYHNVDMNFHSNENLIFLSIIVVIYLHDVNKKCELNTDYPLSVCLHVVAYKVHWVFPLKFH